MKKNSFIIVLLLFLFFFTSCLNNSEYSNYYEKAINAQNEGNIEELRNNILLYMLTYNNLSEADQRNNTIKIYTALGFPNTLNVTLLKPDDILEGRITLYKSYAALGQNQKALDILENTIHGFLPMADYVTLIVNFPTESEYTVSILKQWLNNLNKDDKSRYLELVNSFANSQISESSAKEALKICENLADDFFYKSDNIELSFLYKTTAILLEKLYDNYNARRYWRQAYYLNPQDPECGDKF